MMDATESAFGGELEWQRLDNKRVSRIRKAIFVVGCKDEASVAKTQIAMVEAMIQLEKALKPHLQAVAAALNLT
jgi:hypothetical protein